MSDHASKQSSSEPSPARRGILKWATIVLSALAASATGIPIVGFLLSPLRRESDRWVKAGPVDKFPKGETQLVDVINPLGRATDGVTEKLAVYVRHVSDGTFQTFAVNCTHLGCPVNWFPQAGLFMCPCHGGVYYDDGAHASGPPPRGLYQYEHKIESGQLMVKVGHMPTLQQPA